jgi:hypothetical protein
MSEALDPVPLLKHLHERGVAFIVIGGLAVSAHGHVRPSKDLDVVPDASDENLARLSSALQAIDAAILDTDDFARAELPMDPTQRDDLAHGGNFCLLTRLGRLDVMQWVGGIDGDDLYTELEREALEGEVEGVPVRVCGLEHLRAMKRAAGRPQDLEDLKRLAAD